jgi:Phage terminase large subunit (GpA)
LTTDRALVDDLVVASRAERLRQAKLIVDGMPFDIESYPYLWDLYDMMGEIPRITIRKGAQMGFTVSLVVGTIDCARFTYPRGILYLMPTRDDVLDFSRARFDRLLKENWDTLGRHVHGTDSMAIKRIGSAFIYFRGAKSRSQLKSIPVDLLVTDERDEMDPKMVELADKRLDGSRFAHHITLSTPTIPDYGVDLDYQSSDQRMWHIKCDACGKWTCLELEFPGCLIEQSDGTVIRACKGCQRMIRPQRGQWVAAKPEVKDHVGLYVSQLNSPTVSPLKIATEWKLAEAEGGNKLREFRNSRLGLAHADIEDVLTEELLREICTQDAMRTSAAGPTAWGVDIGKSQHHWVVGERQSDNFAQVLAYGVARSWEELHDIYQRYNVAVGVIDQMAETSAVRDFCEQHGGLYGCWYSEAQRSDYDWIEREKRVTVNRTECLDASHRAILHKRIKTPRPGDAWKSWVEQMTNIARITVRDDQTGTPKVRWIIRGNRKNDHWRHALAYFCVALERAPIAERARRILTPYELGASQRRTSWMAE